MKTILNFRVALVFLLILSVIGCRPDDPKKYEGTSALYFEKTNDDFLSDAGTFKDYKIDFGTLAAIPGSADVSLVKVGGNAVAGTDYQILGGGHVNAGGVGGSFIMRVFGTPLSSTVAKTVVFELSSAAVKNGAFNQKMTINLKRSCSATFFVGTGNFQNKGWWNGQSGTPVVVIKHPTEANTLIIQDYFEPGYDFKIKYDANFNVTFAEQNSGYYSATNGGYIWARPSVATSPNHGVSTIDFCARKINLVVNWYIPGVGGWGNQIENFTGL